jgi:FMN phosphatase YigB (HAD superfamily)
MQTRNDAPLVIFDLGRVLIRLCDDWRHACELAGVAVPANCPELSDDEQARMADATARYDSGQIDLRGYAREVCAFRGLRPEDIVAMNRAYLRGPYPGARELLDELHTAGVATACLSNTSEPHCGMMLDPGGANYLGLERMTYRFPSHLIGAIKPHDTIYAYVERTTALAPQAIVFFDDLEANVAAAQRRGWRAHQIRIDADPIEQVRAHLRAHGILR